MPFQNVIYRSISVKSELHFAAEISLQQFELRNTLYLGLLPALLLSSKLCLPRELSE